MKLLHALAGLGITGAGFAWFCAAPQHRPTELARRIDIATKPEPRPPALVEDARPRPAHHAMAPVPAEPLPSAPAPRAPEPERDNEASYAKGVEPAIFRERLEDHFARERHDPTWAADAQRTAETRIVGTIPETSELRSIECRTSMCRIETVHRDIEHYQHFIQQAFMSPETHIWNGGFFATLLGAPTEGRVVTVAYLARDGEALPSIPEVQ